MAFCLNYGNGMLCVFFLPYNMFFAFVISDQKF